MNIINVLGYIFILYTQYEDVERENYMYLSCFFCVTGFEGFARRQKKDHYEDVNSSHYAFHALFIACFFFLGKTVK